MVPAQPTPTTPASPLARLAAALIDGVILVVGFYPVGFAIGVAFGLSVLASRSEGVDPDEVAHVKRTMNAVTQVVRVLMNDKGQMPHDRMAQTMVVSPRRQEALEE